MAENFYTILTAVGKAKIANAYTLGTTVNLTHLAVGDGNGSYYNPTESQTALRNELWRGVINSITVDGQNPNWIVIEAIIPTSDGGFMIREVGVFDDAGDLVAIGKYPETYKPVPTEGSAKDLYIRMILEVSNASSVTLKIDPAVILATKKQVDEAESRAKAYTDIHRQAAILDHPDSSVTDAKIGDRTPDQAQVPASPGTGRLGQILSWFANRIKTVVGKDNWWDTPTKSLEQLNTDVVSHLADKANPHQVTAAQTGALVSVDGVSNAGGNIDLVAGANIAITPDDANNRITIGGTGTWPNADTVDGAHAGTAANNVLKLDASGLVPLGNIPAILTGKSADKVDNIHFQIYNGVLQYDDGTGWKDVALIATEPGIADINLSSASANTWYIVVDITGKGVLYRIQGSTGQSNNYLQIRVTLDGVSYTLSSTLVARLIGDGLGFEAMMYIKFASSLKVEVQHTYSSSTALTGIVDYGLL